jgi:SNF2 family DNA or RNA helicase
MTARDRVRRISTGEDGVVIGSGPGSLLKVAFANGTVLVHADELSDAPDEPTEQLTLGQIGHAEPYALRLQSLYLRHAYQYDPLTCLGNARIEPQLHQVYVARRVTHKLQPRMILADEVGLGKTVEAGLIIKELRARGLVSRVLVVVPASLQLQWQSELRSKFNEEFDVIDSAALQYLGKGGANPWMARPNVICSLNLAANPKHAERIVEAEWDLVIFDEAHRVRRSLQGRKVNSTQAYKLADELKDLVNGLLLLTATPMQVHPFELYSLIELVEPGLYETFDGYEQRRDMLPQLNKLMKALNGWRAMSAADQATAVREQAALLRELGVDAKGAMSLLGEDSQRERVQDQLVAMHPLSEALVRNRKAEIGGFTSREARTIPVALDDDELALYEEVTEYIRNGYNRAQAERNIALGFVMVTYHKMLASSSHAIRQSFRRRVAKLRKQLGEAVPVKPRSESYVEDLRESAEITTALDAVDDVLLDAAELLMEIQELEGLIYRLGDVRDSKAAALLEALDQIFADRPQEKVVIFTQFIETQDFLAAMLRRDGLAVSTFNGQMSLDDKEAAVRKFRETDQILISTEAGGEGRNFQFAHLMVNYDLPWNPMKVEQRIGRLDRIGQTEPVRIYNLYCAGTVEERVLEVLANRIGLFQESVGSLDPILGTVERDIEALLLLGDSNHLADRFTRFEVDLEQRVREARETERTLADFVLDRASLRRDRAYEVLKENPLARWRDLETFAGACLRYFGGGLHEHFEGGQVVSLSPNLMARTKQRSSTIRGTFDPDAARDMEELPFFAFGHWLVEYLMALPVDVSPAVTAIRTSPDAPPGEWIEVYYEVQATGVKPAGWFILHLIGPDLAVRSSRVTAMPAVGRALPGKSVPEWATAAVEASASQFEKDFEEARAQIQADKEASRQEALQRAQRVFAYKEKRLTALIADQQAWISEKEASGSERDRRILPARRGQVKKRQDRLISLKSEYELEQEEIMRRQPGTSAAVLAAGVVIGE